MVKVYQFKLYDADKDEEVVPPFKSTEERIAMRRGELIAETEQEVSESDLDDHARYWPEVMKNS